MNHGHTPTKWKQDGALRAAEADKMIKAIHTDLARMPRDLSRMDSDVLLAIRDMTRRTLERALAYPSVVEATQVFIDSSEEERMARVNSRPVHLTIPDRNIGMSSPVPRSYRPPDSM